MFSERWEDSFRSTVPGKASTTTRATSAIAPTAANVRRGSQRRAASTTRPTSSAPSDDCDSVRTRPANSTATAAPAYPTVRRRGDHSITATSASITSARKRPKMLGSKNSEFTRK